MIKNIRHTGIVVSDIDKSLHFYENLLGFKVVKRIDEEGSYIDNLLKLKNGKVTTIKMCLANGHMIELLYFHNFQKEKKEKKIDDIGLTHFSITVDNISILYARLTKKGINFLSHPQISSDGYAKVAFCKDPDGVFVEIVEILKK